MAKVKMLNEKVRRVSVATLREHPENPNESPEDALSRSIDEIGFYGTIVAQKSTGFVLAGNHRLRVLKERDPDAEVDVAFVDVSDAGALKILLADNRIAEFGVRQDEGLAAILKKLDEEDDLEGTGYDEDDLSAVIDRLEGRGSGATGRVRKVEFEVVDLDQEELEHTCPKCGFEF